MYEKLRQEKEASEQKQQAEQMSRFHSDHRSGDQTGVPAAASKGGSVCVCVCVCVCVSVHVHKYACQHVNSTLLLSLLEGFCSLKRSKPNPFFILFTAFSNDIYVAVCALQCYLI